MMTYFMKFWSYGVGIPFIIPNIIVSGKDVYSAKLISII